MASLTDYFAGLSVTSTEIQQSELLAEQVLQAKYPSIDLREGTAVRDLVIRPFATLLAMVNKGLNLYFEQNTLDKVDDETSTAMVDSIMSNWFIYRNLGTKAVVNARLYFARSKNITLTADTYFSTDNTLKFVVGATTYIPSTSLTLDTFNNEYFYDIDLTAESAGTEYNLSSGSLLYFSNFDPYFLRAEITFLQTEAGDPETNTQFIERAETAISTRNLINNPSIISNLQANYNSLKDILPVGYGDPEMIRDRVTVNVASSPDPVLLHIGGKVDVYCRAGLEYELVQLTSDATGKVMIPGPAIDIERSTTTGGDEDDTIPVYLQFAVTTLTSSGLVATVVTASPHGYSSNDLITIEGATPAGYNLTEVAITYINTTTFSYPIPSTLASPATGTITVKKATPYTIFRSSNVAFGVGAGDMTRVGTAVTVVAENHPFVVNRYVTISGANESAYNGDFLVTSVQKDEFTYTALSTPSASPATGTITALQVASDTDKGFSDKNTSTDSIIYADFGVGQADRTASFNVLKHRLIDDVQGYLDDADNKVVCGDYMARGFNLYFLEVEIVGYNGPSPDATVCQTLTNNYLTSLAPGDSFVMGDYVSTLHAGGIINVRTPIVVNYKKYTRDMILPPITGVITDYLDPNDRTSIFYLDTLTTDNASI